MDNFSGILRTTLLASLQRMIAFLPNLLSAVLILAMGWALAFLVSRGLLRLFKTLRLDEAAQNRGFTSTLNDIGISAPPSKLVSSLSFWLTLLLMLQPFTQALRLTYLSHLVATFLGFIPSVIAATVILLVGLSLARLIAGSVTRAAQTANLEYAGALGAVARYFLSLIVVIITLAQLGVQTAILTVILAVVLLSLGIASALAFGTGSKAVVANILAGAFIRDHFPQGREIEVQGVHGQVVSVNSVGTTVDASGRIVTIPNSVLMENIVD